MFANVSQMVFWVVKMSIFLLKACKKNFNLFDQTNISINTYDLKCVAITH